MTALAALGPASQPLQAQTVTATVATGTAPSAVAVNPVTNKTYVANSGSNNVTVIDGATNTTSSLNVGASPAALAVNTVTNKIYVANNRDGSMTVIDGATNATLTLSVNNIAASYNPVAIAVNPVTNKIYMTASNADQLTQGAVFVINGATNSVSKSISAQDFARAVTINPVTNRIYVIGEDAGGGAPIYTVWVIDGATDNVIFKKQLNVGSELSAVAVNTATNEFFLLDRQFRTLNVFNGTDNSIKASVNVGIFPGAVGVNTQTNKIYVANTGSNSVTVVDGTTDTVTATLSAASNPSVVAVDETTNKIYVLNKSSNNVTVIDGSDNSTQTVSVGTGPSAAGVNPTTNAIYVANTGGNTVSVIDGPASITNPDFALNASPMNPAFTPGNSGASVISTTALGGFSSDISLSVSGLPAGVTAALSATTLPAPGSGNSTLTLSASTTTAPGTYAIPITASGGGTTHTINLALIIVNPGFVVSASPASVSVGQGSSAKTTVTITVTDSSFNGLMFFDISGLPAGVTASFNPGFIPSPGNGSSTLTFTASGTAAQGTTNVTVIANKSGGFPPVSRTTKVPLTVTGPPDFTLTGLPSSLLVVQGGSNSATVTTGAISGFNSNVALSVSGLPSGVTASLNPATIPAPGSGSSTVTFTAGNSAAVGTANVTLTATGGGITHTQTVSLTVTAGRTLVYTFPAATTVGSVRVVTEGAPNLDYNSAPGTTCTTQTYNAGDSCTVIVSFVARAPGVRKGAVQIVDNLGQLVFQTLLSNIGQGAEVVLLPGDIDTLAGFGFAGFSGDNGHAFAALLNEPFGVAVDPAGNKYIADLLNHRIRKVNASGIITTIAGNGTPEYSGDGGSATSAELDQPLGVALDGAGNLYIADAENNLIRKIDAVTGIITTVAGSGVPGDSGDDGPATSAQMLFPFRVAVDAVANLYIADDNNRIRKVDAASGFITTVAGNGTAGFSGDNGPATAAQLNGPRGVALDAAGNIYIAEYFNSRIRKVDASTGIITTVAGDGHLPGDGTIPPDAGLGDGGPAVNAHLNRPSSVAVDAGGNLYIADSGTHVIRKVDAASGIINRIAGALDLGQGLDFNGDNQRATLANIHDPDDVALDDAGNLYIPDALQHRVRKVSTIPLRIDFHHGSASPTYPVTVSNIGNQPLTFSSITVTQNFGIDTSVTTCSTSQPLSPGGSCVVGVFFTPPSSGNAAGLLRFVDNAMNGSGQTVTLFGSSQ